MRGAAVAAVSVLAGAVLALAWRLRARQKRTTEDAGGEVDESSTNGATETPVKVLIAHDEGIAEDVANSIPQSSPKIDFVKAPIDDFKKMARSGGTGEFAVVVVIVSTLENEEPSEAAGSFFRWVHRKDHPSNLFAGKLRYTVLGLGDSNLLLDRQTTTGAGAASGDPERPEAHQLAIPPLPPKIQHAAKDCNQIAQKLDTRLSSLGAERACPRGEADERTGNTEIAHWIEHVLAPALRQL